jgi:hypothetical protein
MFTVFDRNFLEQNTRKVIVLQIILITHIDNEVMSAIHFDSYLVFSLK